MALAAPSGRKARPLEIVLLMMGSAGKPGPARLAAPRGTAARLWTCPRCGYDLAGLPGAGACPECGELREDGWVRVSGWARARDMPLGVAHLLRSALAVLGAVVTVGLPLLWFTRAAFLSVQSVLTLLVVGSSAVVVVVLVGLGVKRGSPPLAAHCHAKRIVFQSRLMRDCECAWEQVQEIEVRGLARGVWAFRVRFAAPKAADETAPPWKGHAEFRMVFRGTRRDAALVRRVLRERSGRPVKARGSLARRLIATTARVLPRQGTEIRRSQT